MADRALVEVRQLSKTYIQKAPFVGRLFGVRDKRFTALRSIELDILQGETLGIVGESGSGKSTLGRILAGLIAGDAGTIRYRGHGTDQHGKSAPFSPRVQMVFQNPYASLNPRHSIRKILTIALKLQGMRSEAEINARLRDLFHSVRLNESYLDAFPYALSGGQRQRVAIARALAMNPAFLILDEPTSALDVSIQAQILRLLAELKEKFQLTYLLISHNLSVVAAMADRMAVMKQGEVVEIDTVDSVLETPRHPYTVKLLEAVPRLPVASEGARLARNVP
jgi:ABC-type glutathione transport system ATPase component